MCAIGGNNFNGRKQFVVLVKRLSGLEEAMRIRRVVAVNSVSNLCKPIAGQWVKMADANRMSLLIRVAAINSVPYLCKRIADEMMFVYCSSSCIWYISVINVLQVQGVDSHYGLQRVCLLYQMITLSSCSRYLFTPEISELDQRVQISNVAASDSFPAIDEMMFVYCSSSCIWYISVINVLQVQGVDSHYGFQRVCLLYQMITLRVVAVNSVSNLCKPIARQWVKMADANRMSLQIRVAAINSVPYLCKPIADEMMFVYCSSSCIWYISVINVLQVQGVDSHYGLQRVCLLYQMITLSCSRYLFTPEKSELDQRVQISNIAASDSFPAICLMP
ncbi:hypothetical protein QVD17_38219 [Tagetes erecta]|uniref:Uncharacterized protein n=1 Tax=Tagetes erecta TaxID=13708 RepID=A0AAD8NJX2_TARER|nr:hypothetical protein QVD17_38219 [Tagetes erecta]